MAEAQKLVGIGGMDRLLNLTSIIAKVDSTALNKIDLHQFIDEYADALGVSPKIVRSDDKVEEIMNAQAAAQNREQNVQAIGELSSAARNLSQTDMENDSALTRLVNEANAGALTQTAV